MDIIFTMRISAAITAIGIVICALEDWRNRDEYSDAGLMAWPVAELGIGIPAPPAIVAINHLLYNFKTFLILVWFRIISGVALLIVSLLMYSLLPMLTGLLLIAMVITLVRSGYGADGSDQMNIVMLTGLTLAGLFPKEDSGQLMALWFVTLQLVLSYTIAGVAKAYGAPWRDGSGIVGILSTHSYGSPLLNRVLHQHRWLALTSSWSVIIFESTFWMVLFLPQPGVATYLLLGLVFHISISIFMGLNTFLFAFLATYPIAWYCLSLDLGTIFTHWL